MPLRWLVPFLALFLAAATARAEDEAPKSPETETTKDDKQEIQELKERVDRLEAEKKADKEQEHAVQHDLDEVEEGLGLNMVVRRGEVWAMFQLFGDTGFSYFSPELPNRGNAFFFEGSLDLFFTARVGDHFQALSETVFKTSIGATADTGAFDQERLWGAWQFSDLFQVKLGLEHGPISRWNNLYHHGRWLELTVTRPFLARFEGDGGILPMHEAGIEVLGSLDVGNGRLTYVFFLSNGRGLQPSDVEKFSDHNDAKAFTWGLAWEPGGQHPLWIGVFIRSDELPPVPTDPLRIHAISEIIVSLQIDYRGERIQVLSEVAWISDDDRTGDTTYDHVTAYIQVGYSMNDQWTPYVRFDIRDMEQGDPYYMAANRDLDVYEITLGARFDVLDNAALKMEIGFGERDQRAGVIVSDQGYIRVGLQFAFVF